MTTANAATTRPADPHAEGRTVGRRTSAGISTTSLRPGGTPLDEGYGPDEAISELPDAFVPLAVRALDRVLADDSEIRDCWRDSADSAEWADRIKQLRATLGV